MGGHRIRMAVVAAVAAGFGCDGRALRLSDGGPGGRGAGGSAPRGTGGAGAGSGSGAGVDAGTDLRVLVHDAATDTETSRPGDALPADARLADAGAGDGGAADADGTVLHARVLSLVLEGAPWYASQFTQGIAVDALDRVYVGDSANIYVVDGISVSTHLTAAEAMGPAYTDARLGDFDIAPDDQLYIVASGFLMGTGDVTRIVRSRAGHQAEPWVDVPSQIHSGPRKLAVVDGETVVASTRDEGFWTFTAAGGRMVYTSAQIQSTNGCALEDLVAAPSGVFLYQSGCNGYPLLRGRADGTGVGVLYATAILQQPSPPSADNYLCVARDPSSGFYFIVEDSGDGADRLYHVTEDAQEANGLSWIATVPSFGEAAKAHPQTYGFRYCSLAAARDGTVFFQTYAQLWKVSP